jgi:hypothetical protein
MKKAKRVENTSVSLAQRMRTAASALLAVLLAASLGTTSFNVRAEEGGGGSAASAAAELAAILAMIKSSQREEFDKNVPRWEEVAELLRQYVAYSRAEEVRHGQWQQNNRLLDQAKRNEFATTFRGLVASLREVKGTDPSSKALRSGLNTGASTQFDSLYSDFSGGGTDSYMSMLEDGSFFAGSGKNPFDGVIQLNNVSDIDRLEAMLRAQNAGKPNADVLTLGVKHEIQRAKHRADQAGTALASVKSAATGTSKRLTAIEALVQQASALGAIDPITGQPQFDGAKLAELRTYLSSVSAMQNEELVKLNAKGTGTQASDEMAYNALRAAQITEVIKRAKGN